MNQEELNQALFEAIVKQNVSDFNRLLKLGADVNATNEDRDTPLHTAACLGPVSVVENLIKSGANVNARNKRRDSPLHNAPFEGSSSITELLIKSGAKIHAKNRNGQTPLMTSCSADSEESASLLIKAGADVNTQSKREKVTSLHLTVFYGNSVIARNLLKAGADISLKDRDGKTPLDNARDMGHQDMVQLLESHLASLEKAEIQSVIIPGEDNPSKPKKL